MESNITSVRTVVREVLLREDLDSAVLIMTEDKSAISTFVGNMIMKLLTTRRGRKLIASALRVPLAIISGLGIGSVDPHKLAWGNVSDRFKQSINLPLLLQIKTPAMMIAKLGNILDDMDDSTAKEMLSLMSGEQKAVQSVQQVSEPPKATEPEKTQPQAQPVAVEPTPPKRKRTRGKAPGEVKKPFSSRERGSPPGGKRRDLPRVK